MIPDREVNRGMLAALERGLSQRDRESPYNDALLRAHPFFRSHGYDPYNSFNALEVHRRVGSATVAS